MTKFISMRQLKDLVGLSKTTIYKRISTGAFPRAVPLGPKRVVFIETEIEAWMRNQIRVGRKDVQSSTIRQARAVKAVGMRRDRRSRVMTQQLSPNSDNEAAIQFLKLVYPEGPWVLTAIRTDRKGVETRTFHPATEEELVEWLTAYHGKRNIYWSVNPPVRDLQKKAAREDIKEVAYLHVDIDPRAGDDIKSEQKRCLGLLTINLPASVPPPTIILFSGGGYQAFWKLKTSIEINGDLAKAEEAMDTCYISY